MCVQDATKSELVLELGLVLYVRVGVRLRVVEWCISYPYTEVFKPTTMAYKPNTVVYQLPTMNTQHRKIAVLVVSRVAVGMDPETGCLAH